jgi:deazaflavin-dependent oxidoreductase (nitroreductase family)
MAPATKDAVSRVKSKLHRRIFLASKGKVLGRVGGMPVLALTTVGRRSGRPHTVMLTSPVQRDGSYVVVASDGGDPEDPDWFRNVRATPQVQVVVDGAERSMSARILTASEKQEVWTQVVARNDVYAGYQRRTTRDLPLVWLEPVDAAAT